jgi:hypothetical protein
MGPERCLALCSFGIPIIEGCAGAPNSRLVVLGLVLLEFFFVSFVQGEGHSNDLLPTSAAKGIRCADEQIRLPTFGTVSTGGSACYDRLLQTAYRLGTGRRRHGSRLDRAYRRMAHVRNIRAMKPAPALMGIPAMPDSPGLLPLLLRTGRLGSFSEAQKSPTFCTSQATAVRGSGLLIRR